MSCSLFALFTALRFTLLSLSVGGTGAPTPMDTVVVILGADTIWAEVADDPAEQIRGLKGRVSIPEGTGLLFIFDEAAERSFWMVGTLVDLDIAFLDADLRIIRITTMKAGTSVLTYSMGPAMFALEVRAGWFAERKIPVGTIARVIFDPRPDGFPEVVRPLSTTEPPPER